jgi:hypothetical protein
MAGFEHIYLKNPEKAFKSLVKKIVIPLKLTKEEKEKIMKKKKKEYQAEI